MRILGGSVKQPLLLRGIAVLPLLLTSCVGASGIPQARSTPLFPMTSSLPAPRLADTWTSSTCGYSATFTELPRSPRKDELPAEIIPDFEVMGARLFQDQQKMELAVCACPLKSNIHPSNSTKFQLEQIDLQRSIRSSAYKYENSVAEGQGGVKIWDYSESSPSAIGNVIFRGRNYLTDSCIFVVATSDLVNKEDPQAAYRFIASARSLSVPAQSLGSTSLPVPADVAQRLRALKNLSDQQLITPAQYEAKRKTIVDGL